MALAYKDQEERLANQAFQEIKAHLVNLVGTVRTVTKEIQAMLALLVLLVFLELVADRAWLEVQEFLVRKGLK